MGGRVRQSARRAGAARGGGTARVPVDLRAAVPELRPAQRRAAGRERNPHGARGRHIRAVPDRHTLQRLGGNRLRGIVRDRRNGWHPGDLLLQPEPGIRRRPSQRHSRHLPDAASPGDDDLHRRLRGPDSGSVVDRHRLAGAAAPGAGGGGRHAVRTRAHTAGAAGVDRYLFQTHRDHLMMPPRAGKLAILATAALTGCAVGPNFHAPAPPATDRYTAQPLDQNFLPGKIPSEQWWLGFGSSEIDGLVEQALRANPTMQAAEATLRQSLETVAAQRGAFFPSAQVQASASKNRNAVQVLAPTLTSGAATFALYTPQLTVSYVPDLFGGNRRQVESLQALADANRCEDDAAYLTLIANVVSAAIQEAGLRAQIEATQQVISLERESLGVMRQELDLGD